MLELMGRGRAALLIMLTVGCAPGAPDGGGRATDDPYLPNQPGKADEHKSIEERYLDVRGEAVVLAGEPGDIAQRVVFLHQIFEDSNGNHAFPEVALHGALWAHGFLGTVQYLEDLAARFGLTFLGNVDRIVDTVARFRVQILEANRAVFIDIAPTSSRWGPQWGRPWTTRAGQPNTI